MAKPKFLSALALVLVVALPQFMYAQATNKAITFTKDVAPILQEKREACHRVDSMAPMSLVRYDEARRRPSPNRAGFALLKFIPLRAKGEKPRTMRLPGVSRKKRQMQRPPAMTLRARPDCSWNGSSENKARSCGRAAPN